MSAGFKVVGIWGSKMCDFSLHSVKSRPARVGDRIVTRDFETGTRGFAASDDGKLAVCILPGTELSFVDQIKWSSMQLWPWRERVSLYSTAVFRQINKHKPHVHHDALEFPDGQIVLLTLLSPGQLATVLQLPAENKVERELSRESADLTSVQTSLTSAAAL
jgi:hypothetical protein